MSLRQQIIRTEQELESVQGCIDLIESNDEYVSLGGQTFEPRYGLRTLENEKRKLKAKLR